MYIKVRTSESAKAYSKCERRVKELGFTNEEDKKNQGGQTDRHQATLYYRSKPKLKLYPCNKKA